MGQQAHRVAANGANIPAIGLGTWTLTEETATRLVAHALDVGYRHIDTAAMYGNEEAVGAGLRASGVARSDIFLTTKVWYTDIGARDLRRSVEASMKRLGVDYLDLVLIHWPSHTIPMSESIGELNEVREEGWARNIGVSNFTVAQVQEAARLSPAPIAVNQIEYHPFLSQDRVIAACRALGVGVISYCPLARGGELADAPAIAAAAARTGRSPAQVVLRWHVQQDGVGAIPRSSNPGRIAENLAVFDFELTDGEMAAISALKARHMRICDLAHAPDWDPA